MSVAFKPLGNRVLLQRDEVDGEKTTAGGLIIPDIAREKPQTATVVAVGPGLPMQDGGDAWHAPMSVKVGDRVLLGKYSGYDVSLSGNVYTILAETDILGVLNAD